MGVPIVVNDEMNQGLGVANALLLVLYKSFLERSALEYSKNHL